MPSRGVEHLSGFTLRRTPVPQAWRRGEQHGRGTEQYR